MRFYGKNKILSVLLIICCNIGGYFVFLSQKIMIRDRIVVFMTFEDLTKAYLIKGILDDNDIPCFISDENTLLIYPLYNQCLGGIKLSVFEKDLEKATQVVEIQQKAFEIPEEQRKVNSLDDDGPVCPVCGSQNVAYGASVQHKYSWLTILISIFLQIYPFAIKKSFHCFDCGNDFKVLKKA